MLIVLAGLPGSGKTTLASDLARALKCAVLGVDEVEAAMWRAGIHESELTRPAAYDVAAALAGEQVMLGHDVVIDAVNGPEVARARWRELAVRLSVDLRFIEVRCSDEVVHRVRLTHRQRTSFPEPTWEGVLRRRAGFPPWTDDRLTVDTVKCRSDNLETTLSYLGRERHRRA